MPRQPSSIAWTEVPVPVSPLTYRAIKHVFAEYLDDLHTYLTKWQKLTQNSKVKVHVAAIQQLIRDVESQRRTWLQALKHHTSGPPGTIQLPDAPVRPLDVTNSQAPGLRFTPSLPKMSFKVQKQLNDIGYAYGAYRLKKGGRLTHDQGLAKGREDAKVQAYANDYANWSLQRVHDKKDSPEYAIGRITAFARHRAPRDKAALNSILRKLHKMRT